LLTDGAYPLCDLLGRVLRLAALNAFVDATQACPSCAGLARHHIALVNPLLDGAVRLLVALLLGEVVFDLDAPGGQGLDGVRNVVGRDAAPSLDAGLHDGLHVGKADLAVEYEAEQFDTASA